MKFWLITNSITAIIYSSCYKEFTTFLNTCYLKNINDRDSKKYPQFQVAIKKLTSDLYPELKSNLVFVMSACSFVIFFYYPKLQLGEGGRFFPSKHGFFYVHLDVLVATWSLPPATFNYQNRQILQKGVQGPSRSLPPTTCSYQNCSHF